MSNISLNNLTDEQNALLNELAYADLSDWRGMTLCKLSLKGDLSYRLVQAGLGGLEIKDYTNNNPYLKNGSIPNPTGTKSGFCAIAFEDDIGNVGMSFRGSEDLELLNLTDRNIDQNDNYLATLAHSTKQINEAKAFFEKNAKGNNNFLYGHSKGGNLAQEVFAEYYKSIEQVHVINPFPINFAKLNLNQQAAFFKQKMDVLVIGGDYVSGLGVMPYSNRIRFVYCDMDKYNKKKDSEKFNAPHDYSLATINPDKSYKTGSKIDVYNDFPGQYALRETLQNTLSSLQFGSNYGLCGVFTIQAFNFTNFMINDAPEIAKNIWESTVNFFDKVVKAGKDFVEKVNNFFETAYNNFKKWLIDSLNNLFSYGAAIYESLFVSTQNLRNLANSLQRVQNKISNVDRSLDILRGSMEWYEIIDKIKIGAIDFLTVGYDWDLKNCITYLNEAADRLDACENRLLSAAMNF